MNLSQWYGVARDIALTIIGVFVFYWGQDRKKTADAIELRLHQLEDDLKDAKQASQTRFDQASRESSKLAGIVQGLIGRVDRLPDDLRDRFLPLDVWEVSERRRQPRNRGD